MTPVLSLESATAEVEMQAALWVRGEGVVAQARLRRASACQVASLMRCEKLTTGV